MRILVAILIFLFSPFLANTQEAGFIQENVVQIEKKEFENLKDELDYSKTKRKLSLRESKKKKKKKKEKKLSNFNIPGLGTAFSILAYILIFVLVATLLYLIFSNIKLDKKLSPIFEEESTEDIQDIEEFDTRKLYNEALRNGNYRAAIRMQFLYCLQLLSLKEAIFWKPEKTNRDYNREIVNIDLKNKFRQLASFYELVWYGNNPIDEQRFNSLNRYFTSFINEQNV